MLRSVIHSMRVAPAHHITGKTNFKILAFRPWFWKFSIECIFEHLHCPGRSRSVDSRPSQWLAKSINAPAQLAQAQRAYCHEGGFPTTWYMIHNKPGMYHSMHHREQKNTTFNISIPWAKFFSKNCHEKELQFLEWSPVTVFMRFGSNQKKHHLTVLNIEWMPIGFHDDENEPERRFWNSHSPVACLANCCMTNPNFSNLTNAVSKIGKVSTRELSFPWNA